LQGRQLEQKFQEDKMLKKSMLFAMLLALSSLALAQQKSQQQFMAEGLSVHGNATTTCDVSYSSGTGANATTLCVTANGNISEFSIAGEEMIAVGAIAEGYGICDATSGVAYYDYAYEDSGNWGPATFSASGNVITVTRVTSDGIWSLKQTITNTPATTSVPGTAKTSMALKNLSGVTRSAYILRYADVDANNNVSNNDFDYTSQTAFGLYPGFGRGLAIVNNTFNSKFSQIAFAQGVFSGPNPCNATANLAAQPFHGDGSIVQFWSFTAQHGVNNIVNSFYKPI
jgi:hypothetical protein